MRRTVFCNHYRAMSDHATCEAGVAYDKFKGIPFDARPCFGRNGGSPPPGCELAQFPTPEQIAAEEAEFQKRMENTMQARAAIVAHCGGPWKKGTPGTSGKINCPVCGGDATLRFSRAGINGHIHAACTTEGCVRWME